MYEVITTFLDLTDDHIYEEGDRYPIEGSNPTKHRIDELLGYENRYGLPLIREVAPKRKATKKSN